jgi:hypothetical protein
VDNQVSATATQILVQATCYAKGARRMLNGSMMPAGDRRAAKMFEDVVIVDV